MVLPLLWYGPEAAAPIPPLAWELKSQVWSLKGKKGLKKLCYLASACVRYMNVHLVTLWSGLVLCLLPLFHRWENPSLGCIAIHSSIYLFLVPTVCQHLATCQGGRDELSLPVLIEMFLSIPLETLLSKWIWEAQHLLVCIKISPPKMWDCAFHAVQPQRHTVPKMVSSRKPHQMFSCEISLSVLRGFALTERASWLHKCRSIPWLGSSLVNKDSLLSKIFSVCLVVDIT